LNNFGASLPIVYRGPYEYSVPGAKRDFSMQTEPIEIMERVTTDEHG
jgi:cytochrome c oxidase subunit I